MSRDECNCLFQGLEGQRVPPLQPLYPKALACQSAWLAHYREEGGAAASALCLVAQSLFSRGIVMNGKCLQAVPLFPVVVAYGGGIVVILRVCVCVFLSLSASDSAPASLCFS